MNFLRSSNAHTILTKVLMFGNASEIYNSGCACKRWADSTFCGPGVDEDREGLWSIFLSNSAGGLGCLAHFIGSLKFASGDSCYELDQITAVQLPPFSGDHSSVRSGGSVIPDASFEWTRWAHVYRDVLCSCSKLPGTPRMVELRAQLVAAGYRHTIVEASHGRTAAPGIVSALSIITSRGNAEKNSPVLGRLTAADTVGLLCEVLLQSEKNAVYLAAMADPSSVSSGALGPAEVAAALGEAWLHYEALGCTLRAIDPTTDGEDGAVFISAVVEVGRRSNRLCAAGEGAASASFPSPLLEPHSFTLPSSDQAAGRRLEEIAQGVLQHPDLVECLKGSLSATEPCASISALVAACWRFLESRHATLALDQLPQATAQAYSEATAAAAGLSSAWWLASESRIELVPEEGPAHRLLVDPHEAPELARLSRLVGSRCSMAAHSSQFSPLASGASRSGASRWKGSAAQVSIYVDCSAGTLRRMLDFCGQYALEPMDEIEKPLKSANMSENVQQW